MTAAGVQRGACRLLKAHGFAVLTEFTLATGRRADVAAVKADGTIWIVEIKSSPEDFYVDQNGQNTATIVTRSISPFHRRLDAGILPDDAGLIVADSYGAEILRHCAKPPFGGGTAQSSHCFIWPSGSATATWFVGSVNLLRRALCQNALQGAAVHIEAAGSFRDIAIAKFEHTLDVFPTHAVS